MLIVTDLSKAYGAQSLFDGVSFQVAPGERVGLVGRNGSGKSTLFRILLGEEAPDGGRVIVPAGYRIGHLAQHLHFGRRTTLEEAAAALPGREDGADETYRAKAVLSGLGFGEDDLSRAPADLSGGFQVRLNLARALLSDANLLLLDEPTNHLDIVSIRWLRRFLRAWTGELLLITHDRDFMDGVTTHTMAIHRRRVRKMPGGTEKLSRQILQEEEVHERTRINDERERQEAEAFIARFRAQATKARAVQSRIKALARRERLEKLEEIGELDFRFTEAPFAGRRMLEVHDLRFGYDAGKPLIKGLSLSVSRGDRIAVVGPNGRGKTTLLRLLAGELSPLSGAVRPALNLKVGYFGQTNVDRLRADLTVEEEIRQANPALTRTRVRTLCGAMMFEGDAAEKKIAVLSGGERSRVLLGRILAAPVNLLLLDEPTNHLDQESVDAFLAAVSAFDGGVVIVSHLERVLSALATKLVVFDGDKVALFHGGYADFLERVGWQAEAREGPLSRAARERRVHGGTNAAARPGWPSVAEVRTTESDEATDGRERRVHGGTNAARVHGGTSVAGARMAGATKATDGGERPGGRRGLRRQRAEIVTRRSRELGELRRSIDAAEAEITALENRLAGDEAAIVDAAMRNDGAAVRALSASASAARARIEALFGEMAALEEELRGRERFYEAELDDGGG